MSLNGFITLDTDTPSKSGLYVTGLPGVTLSQIDGVTKDEQADTDATFEYLYGLAQTNLKIDLQRALANKFHIDRNIVSRETSKFLADVNDSSDLCGVTIEYLRSKYSRLHLSTVEVFLDSPIFTWITSHLPINNNRAAAFGNDVFVAIGGGLEGGMGGSYSTDGRTWTLSNLSATRIWNDVVYADHVSLFVAVSQVTGSTAGQRISTSQDGITWTLRTTPADDDYTNIAAGNDLIVAISDDSIIRSEDGVTWTTVSETPSIGLYSDIVFGDEKFVIAGVDGISWSSDGRIWHDIEVGTGSITPVGDIAYTNGIFLTNIDNTLFRSVDAITWESVDLPFTLSNIDEVVGLAGIFIVQSTTTVLSSIVSSDGLHWSSVDGSIRASGVAYGNGLVLFVASADASVMELDQEITGFGTIFVYEDDEDGELLGSYSIDAITQGKNTIVIDRDFDADKIFVAVNPVGYFRKTTNKYFTYDYLSTDKLSCTFPCGFGQGSVTQVNDGGLNVTFNVYCSFDKLIDDNLNIFKYALWYRIGVDLMKERIISDRVTRFTVLSPERAKELMDVFNEDYKAALDTAVMNLKLTEDTLCFACKKPIQAITSLP